MGEIDFISLIPYVFITTFTPGPNNISSAAMASRFGFSGTFSYMCGIASGVFVFMSLSGVLSGFLLTILPGMEHFMRWIGAVYILWLAWGLLKSNPIGSEEEGSLSSGFLKGMFLQCANVKVIIYCVTLYTVFLGPILSRPLPVFISAVALALICFSSVLLWALFGVGIKRFLNNERRRKALNYFFAFLLALTALQVADLI